LETPDLLEAEAEAEADIIIIITSTTTPENLAFVRGGQLRATLETP
jgi:hypothetical protein